VDGESKIPADQYDVVIVGSGPAGASTAKALTGAGLKTVIIERRKLPRHKMCSGIIFPAARKFVADNFGELPEEVYCEPHIVYGNRVFGTIDADLIETPFTLFDARENLPEHGINVKREGFDYWLCKQTDADIIDNCRFMSLYKDEGNILVKVKCAGIIRELKTKYLVGADGSMSTVRKSIDPEFDKGLRFIPVYEEWYTGKIDLEPDWLHLFFDRKLGAFMATLFHKDGKIIADTGAGKGESAKKYLKVFIEYLKKRHGLIIEMKTTQHGIVLNDMCATGNFFTGDANALVCGEAGGFMRYAEGITSALHTGAAAGNSILKSIETGKPAIDFYAEAVKPEMEACNRVCRAIQAFTGFNMFTRV